MTDPTHWTTPPTHDDALAWYFGEAESAMGIRSISEAMDAMALAGISGGGNATTDDRLVRRGAVGVNPREDYKPAVRWADGTVSAPDPSKRDRESAVGKYRRIDGHLRGLSKLDFAVLTMAYGWSTCIGQVKAILSEPQRGELFRKRLGYRSDVNHHAGVAFLTKKGRSMSPAEFERWIHAKTTSPADLTEVKRESMQMLREAYNRYADARGRRRRFDRERVTT